jgi:dTDP-glucose 4,6-dehydratase
VISEWLFKINKTMNQSTIIITGGAGFIGSHVVRRFVTRYPEYRIINLDALTYAGNLENLKDVEHAPNYIFEHVDIQNTEDLERIFTTYNPNGIIHLAAESHVDRSILSPMDFVYTNVVGTVNLLNAAKKTVERDLRRQTFLSCVNG